MPGELDATLTVHDERFFLRALTGSDIGIGESFMDGDWTTPDLVPLVRLMLRNRRVLEGQSRFTGALRRLAGGVARRLRDNSLAGSRRHIHRHYDLGNEFFRLFLDADLLMYSCGYFESAADSLEQAQARKVDRICRALKLSPADRVLEIGSGWGGFAVWAATRYGCRVTTTTISDEQYRHVCEWRSRIGEAGSRIDVRRADYRELTGQFDKVVSIEMFEAVGLNHYDEYFTAVDRLLAPDGVMFLQTITVDDQWFPKYHGTPDWIEKYIFPGRRTGVGRRDAEVARADHVAVAVSRRELRHPLRAHLAGLARPVSPEPGARACPRVRRPLHPHVGPVSRVVRSDVPRTPHRPVPDGAAEERRPARPVQRAVVRSRRSGRVHRPSVSLRREQGTVLLCASTAEGFGKSVTCACS